MIGNAIGTFFSKKKGTEGPVPPTPIVMSQGWSVKGKTNEDSNRASVANLTGNGNDLVLSNFLFAENSGYGLYRTKFNGSFWSKAEGLTSVSSSSFTITSSINSNQASMYTSIRGKESNISPFKININGLGDILYYYYYVDSNNTRVGLKLKNGINDLPESHIANLDVNGWVGFGAITDVTDDITIEQIPDYEGYLVTDGVDDKIISLRTFVTPLNFTIVGEWKFLIKEDKACGVAQKVKFYCQNDLEGINLSINNGDKTLLKVVQVKAICSDGRVYDENWNEHICLVGQGDLNPYSFVMGYWGLIYTQIAFKNIAFYNDQVLTKEQCVSEYNKLQAL